MLFLAPRGMKTLNVLLGSSDRTASNRIEALVHDLCFERAMVECRRTARMDDFEKFGYCGWMDLIIFAPDNLLASAGQRGFRQVMLASLRIVQQIRKQSLMPMIAFGVSEQDKMQVLESGVDVVLGPIWESTQLTAELARILNLPVRIENQPSSSRWHFLGGLFRGFTTAKSKA